VTQRRNITFDGVPAVGPFYRVAEVARLLGVSKRQAWGLIAAGRLRTIKFGPRTTRVSAADLREFVDACRQV